jgi:hypothetical protein
LNSSPFSICLSALLFVAPFSRAADPQAVPWPAGVEDNISRILTLRREVVEKHPDYNYGRSPDGEYGKKAEALMDEIAKAITEPALIARLGELEGTDIKAKIALWAVDLAKRPEEYKRFAKWYVNRPLPEESAEYYGRVQNRPPDEPDPFGTPAESNVSSRTSAPDPVDWEDQTEANRHIIEYCYFMPPTGDKFHKDIYCDHMWWALHKIDSLDKSLVIFTESVRLHLPIYPTTKAGPKEGKGPAYHHIFVLSHIPDPESFKALSACFAHPRAGDEVRETFMNRWQETSNFLVNQYRDGMNARKTVEQIEKDIRECREGWIALAKRPWETEPEKAFAQFILSLPEPPPLKDGQRHPIPGGIPWPYTE